MSGLQKLLDDLPWKAKSTKVDLNAFVTSQVLKNLFVSLEDPVEKCRELTLSLMKRSLETCPAIDSSVLLEMTQKLCQRVDDVPFLEPAEELRLQVIDNLILLMKKHTDRVTSDIAETIQIMLVKALTDHFPAVKRSCADLAIMIFRSFPSVAQKSFKSVLKSLLANASHQHSKTRLVTLQAIGYGLNGVLQEEYEALMKESVLHLFQRLGSDRTAGVKIELANTCKSILSHRLLTYRQQPTHRAVCSMDFELIGVMLLVRGDEQEEVASAADSLLQEAVANWHKDMLRSPIGLQQIESNVEDGEWEMINAASTAKESVEEEGDNKGGQLTAMDEVPPHIPASIEDFLVANFSEVSTIILTGVDGWQTESKFKYLRGLNQLLAYTHGQFGNYLPRLFTSLGVQIRDDETEVRVTAEQCCARIGALSESHAILDILLPRVAGEVAGGDTATQRTSAIRMLTHALKGFPVSFEMQRRRDMEAAAHTVEHDIDESSVTEAQTDGAMEVQPSVCAEPPASMEDLVTSVTSTLACTTLYDFREAPVREAALLLVRSILDSFPEECKRCNVLRRNLAVGLVFLCGRCPQEHDVVPESAQTELARLAAMHFPAIAVNLADNMDDLVNQFLAAHYQFVFNLVMFPSSSAQRKDAFYIPTSEWEQYSPCWDINSPAKAAFEVLIRKCPTESWSRQAVVLPVFRNQTQPPVALVPDTAEANAANYAACRGENYIPSSIAELVDVRMSMLALLEGFIRAGSSNWENGRAISDGAEVVIKDIILPNLVWRVGRVEATIRKVALAACYGMLKAGSVKHEVLYKVAATLVPRICSNLDDQESTPRQISCLCLTVLFDRLKGAFGDQALREIYPKLIARLDDSSDAVRLSICSTLNQFLQCSPIKEHYRGTMIDYILDQLFIHLDDPDLNIQNAVLSVIVTAGDIDKDRVLKKAESNRLSHRSPVMCERVQAEVQGFEILAD